VQRIFICLKPALVHIKSTPLFAAAAAADAVLMRIRSNGMDCFALRPTVGGGN
jgi:hypothetical protein